MNRRRTFVQDLSEEYDGVHDGGCVFDVTDRGLDGGNQAWSMATHNTTTQKRRYIITASVPYIGVSGSGHGSDVIHTL